MTAGTVGDRSGAPHASTVTHVAVDLGADPELGLSDREARARLASVGPNALERPDRPPYGAIAARQLADPLVALLVAAAVVSLAIGERVESFAIVAIVVVNSMLGFAQEVNAARAILALRGALTELAAVVRDGREREVPADQLVPGDLIVLREGDRVAADGRLVRADSLAVDESMLTGESVPVDKTTQPVAAAAPLAERASLVLSGTAVTRGSGRALVTATGARAEIGQVARLAERAKPPPTRLQRRLGSLTRAMVLLGLVITLVLAGIRLLQGASAHEAFLLGVSLAVAAVPEGLAATLTIGLALGARRMAARGAIVRRLAAVETLGGATLIASDKTGTLTKNRLTLEAIEPAGSRQDEDVLSGAILASTADLLEDAGAVRVAGDPVEGAFLLAAVERGISPTRVRTERFVVRTVPFDADRRLMTVVYQGPRGLHAFVKGAPEVVLERCHMPPDDRGRWDALAETWARDGLKVLAVAERVLESSEADDDSIERDLDLVGLAALSDPLRDAAAAAIEDARSAGLRVHILTGDHAATAAAIARELRLPPASVSARVTPADKLRLVETFQEQGEVVAVTGDGVNDAPALRQADIGVSMGRSGTQAAREASDIVLTDDDFATIVAAIREGRAIGDNLRKFVAFLLSANFGEVLLFAGAIVAGLGAPMTVVQVLTVNVLTDGLPAVALARDRALPGVLARPPERTDELFSRAGWASLGLVGILVGGAGLAAFLIGRASGGSTAQTMAFATIALSELLVVFAVRSPLRSAWKEPVNFWLIAAVTTSAALLAAALYLPALHDPFGTISLDPPQVAAVLALAAAPLLTVEVAKALLRRRAPAWAAAALRAPQ